MPTSLLLAAILLSTAPADAFDEAELAIQPEIVSAIKRMAVPTAQVDIPSPEYLKFLALGIGPTGEVQILGATRHKGHEGGLCRPGVVAVAHWHSKEMQPGPDALDFNAAAAQQCSIYVVSADGAKIWQVAVVNGKPVQRLLTSGGP